MKIENFDKLSVSELAEKLKDLGISENRLDKAITGSFLPVGTVEFIDFEVDNAGEQNAAIRVITKDGHSCSLSRIQRAGFMGEPKIENIAESTRTPGRFYLRSNTTVNPQLTGNQAALLQKLIGKKYKSDKVTLKVTAYKEDGYNSPEEAFNAVVPYDTWKLTETK